MWFASTQPPYGTSMPQSGRRPQHIQSHMSFPVPVSAANGAKALVVGDDNVVLTDINLGGSTSGM